MLAKKRLLPSAMSIMNELPQHRYQCNHQIYVAHVPQHSGRQMLEIMRLPSRLALAIISQNHEY